MINRQFSCLLSRRGIYYGILRVSAIEPIFLIYLRSALLLLLELYSMSSFPSSAALLEINKKKKAERKKNKRREATLF